MLVNPRHERCEKQARFVWEKKGGSSGDCACCWTLMSSVETPMSLVI